MAKSKKISIDKLKKWAGSQPVFVTLFVILITISSLVTITDGLVKINSFYFSPLWETREAYKKTQMLNVNIPIESYEASFGRPLFINKMDASHKEYIFMDNMFYIQAITDEAGKVVLYSITTRSHKFHPKIRTPFSTDKDNDLIIELGRTKFSTLKHTYINDIGLFLSANMASFYYNEVYYMGNPGRYLTYGLSFNGSGIGETGTPYKPLMWGRLKKDGLIHRINVHGFPDELQKFRDETTVNTYTVMSDFLPQLDVDSEDGWFTLGPETQRLRQLQNWSYPQ